MSTAPRLSTPPAVLPGTPDVSDLERVRTDTNPRESEARLQLALAASGMGTFIWHVPLDRVEPDSRLLELLELPSNTTGLRSADMCGFVHPGDLPRHSDAVARALDPMGDGVLREEVRVVGSDGAERWLSVTAQTVFEPALNEPTLFTTGPRRPVQMAGIVADVTDRKRREANRGVLAELAHDFARLSSPEEIMQTVGEKMGSHLNLSCACLVDVNEARDEARVAYVWRAAGAPTLPGVLKMSAFVTGHYARVIRADDTLVVSDTKADPRVDPKPFAAVSTRAFIAVPFVREGAVKFVLAVCDAKPRQWRDDEVRLCRELSIRLVPRLERARAEVQMAADLRDTRLLRDLSVRLVSEADEHLFFEAIVSAAMAITAAGGASIQLTDPASGELVMLSARGACHSTDVLEPSATVQFTPLVSRTGTTIGRLCTCFAIDRMLLERDLRFLDLLARQAADFIERRRADEALRKGEQRLSDELADTKLLQQLSAQLIKEQDSMSLYDTIVDAATSIMRSECASLQMLQDHGGRSELRLIASRGFNAHARKVWEWVGIDNGTTCARSLNTGQRVVVPDISASDFMAGTRDQELMLAAGLRAAQTTPLVSRGGRTLGMISTMWREPHQPSERDLRLLDILARQAADLMERTQAEEALRRNESALKEADRRKDEFLAMLSHELRNPLAPLRTGLELIRLADNNPTAVEDVRIMMEDQVAHMVRLIDDLLDVSRITSGKIRLQRQTTALVTLVNAAVEANHGAFGAGHVALSIDLPATPVVLDVDPTRIVQVLSNILHNAIKFTDAGGRIRISASIDDSWGDDSRAVVITISDSGVGISKEMLPRVFDWFTQDDAAALRSRSGLGIGLALARQLVEMHAGTIDVHSDGPGLGSRFSVRLPVSAGVAAPRRAPAPDTPRISRRVVVIDDNIPAASAMKRLVTALGGECWVAYDGETGLEHVREFRPDIVFLDIGMPGMDGYETCRRIRQEVGTGVLIVALTGWGQERDKRESAAAGFDIHLAKPADPILLEKLLAEGR